MSCLDLSSSPIETAIEAKSKIYIRKWATDCREMAHKQPTAQQYRRSGLSGTPHVYARVQQLTYTGLPYRRKEFQTNMVKSEPFFLSHGYSLLFFLSSKGRLSCQNVGLGPDWSFEWIVTSLISATANRQSSKGSRQNRGGRGVRRL